MTSLDLLYDLSGCLINSNSVLDYPRLQGETFVNIGGMQLKRKLDALPEDIKTFMDNSPNGIILFAMGFIFNPVNIPSFFIQKIFNVFSKLDQNVILKFSPNNSFVIPNNVMTKNFLPQQEILAHTNTKLFFTHCGMHGVIEAIAYKVPMVGMPIFLDQVDVATRISQRDIGLIIHKDSSEDEIYNAIQIVLNNSK